MWPVLLFGAGARAQSYSFPSSPEDEATFYPTAYVDHGGVDWNCDDLTSAGHLGSDFGAGGFAGMDEGRTVTAAAAGTVVATNDGEADRCDTGTCAGGAGLGNYVQLEHEDGRTTLYAHLAEFSVQVAVGDDVTCGQVLGRMGSSGFSTGPHVHFEVRDPLGVVLDPFNGACSPAPSSWNDQADYGDIPGLGCTVPEGCTPAATLGCGNTIEGATSDPGATMATWQYGCSDWTYSGPELSWTFETPLDEPVTVTLDELTADLDVYVLGTDACDGSGCVGASTAIATDPEHLTFDAAAGAPYTIVVDGWEGAVGPFRLEVACDGVVGEPPDTAPPPSDTGEVVVSEDPLEPGGAPGEGGATLCGNCETGAAGTPLWLLPFWVAFRKRARAWSTLRHDPPAPRRLLQPPG